MPYATLQDLKDRFGEEDIYVVFDRDGDGFIDTAAVDRALADADNEIDSYLTGRYQLPLANVPPALTRLAAQIAMYHASTGTTMTDEKKERYAQAVKMLEKIAAGAISLGLPSADEPPARQPITVQASTRLFGDDELAKF